MAVPSQRLHLPVHGQPSSIRNDGRRVFVQPADVRGRFNRVRQWLFPVLILVLLWLPWVKVDGHPAVFLDVQQRRFYLLGQTFNAQDAWLLFFLLSGLGFALIVVTALWGRVWCGFACPQTVFLEGLYRRFERWIEGPRERRIRLASSPWNLDKLWRKSLKHLLFVAISFVLAHSFVAYFVSMPGLFEMMSQPPSQHPQAFGWSMSLTGVLYFNFSWFREQTCLIVCPYGRMQSLLTDRDTLVVGYDAKRGEPRGKLSDAEAGDCIDCRRCVVVCPTGIDIRNGLQIDCIGCTACIDACDEMMDKVGRDRGLIRYDSQRALEGESRRVWRPRLAVYAVLGVVGLAVAGFTVAQRSPHEVSLLRPSGTPYVVENGRVRNLFELHIVNKRGKPVRFEIAAEPDAVLRHVVPMAHVEIEAFGGVKVPVLVEAERAQLGAGRMAQLRVSAPAEGFERIISARVLGPPPAQGAQGSK